MVMLHIDGVSVALGGRMVVDGVSATLEPGQLVGIIGPNGAGKSTLVRAMLGLVQPAGGTIRVDGVDMAHRSARDVAKLLAYLPQGQTLHWPLDVERLVALGRLPHLGPLSRMGADDVRIVSESMARADVGHLAHRIATELSGGERARVMVARALAVGAKGLIADEPLASLDPGHQIDVMALLSQETRAGSLVVAVLHDLTMAARYCDRLLLIDQGRLVADGSPAEVLTADRLASVYGITAVIDTSARPAMIVPLARV